MNELKQWWAQLAAREQRGVALALAALALALLWWVGIAPALRTLQTAQAQHAKLDAQLQTMRALAQEATSLKAQPKLAADESLRQLENTVKQTLGSTGQLSVSNERANITLKAASPQALATLLAQARLNARVVPSQARLTRSTNNSSNQANTPVWDGVVVLNLPAR